MERISEHPSRSPQFRHLTIHINHYNISTIVTNNQGVVRDWIYDVLQYNSNVVGISAQGEPFSYHGGIDTLVLCVGERCLIYSLRHSIGLAPHHILRDFLHDPNIMFIGLLWTEQQTHQLFNSRPYYLGLRHGMPFDFLLTWDRDGNIPLRVWEIARDVLGLDIEWDAMVGLGDWGADPLSLDQVYQATLISFVSFLTGYRFNHGTLLYQLP